MNKTNHFVVFTISEQQYALPIADVERIIRAVAVTPLPEAPTSVLGVINMNGQIIPVINLRQRLNLPLREMTLSDLFIIVHTSNRTIALLVEKINGVYKFYEQELIKIEKILSKMDYVEEVTKVEGEIILIHNINKFLNYYELQKLDKITKELAVKKSDSRKIKINRREKSVGKKSKPRNKK